MTEKHWKTPAKGDLGRGIMGPPPMEPRSCGCGLRLGRAKDPGTQAGGTHCGHPGWMGRGARCGDSEGSPGEGQRPAGEHKFKPNQGSGSHHYHYQPRPGGGNGQGHPQGESQTLVLQAL